MLAAMQASAWTMHGGRGVRTTQCPELQYTQYVKTARDNSNVQDPLADSLFNAKRSALDVGRLLLTGHPGGSDARLQNTCRGFAGVA